MSFGIPSAKKLYLNPHTQECYPALLFAVYSSPLMDITY